MRYALQVALTALALALLAGVAAHTPGTRADESPGLAEHRGVPGQTPPQAEARQITVRFKPGAPAGGRSNGCSAPTRREWRRGTECPWTRRSQRTERARWSPRPR